MNRPAYRIELESGALPPDDAVYYWRFRRGPFLEGSWFVSVPSNGRAFLGNLCKHTITEHEDGTITVAPSILITGHDGSVHGFLEHGTWRDA